MKHRTKRERLGLTFTFPFARHQTHNALATFLSLFSSELSSERTHQIVLHRDDSGLYSSMSHCHNVPVLASHRSLDSDARGPAAVARREEHHEVTQRNVSILQAQQTQVSQHLLPPSVLALKGFGRQSFEFCYSCFAALMVRC